MSRILAISIAMGMAICCQMAMAQPGPPSFDGLDTDENGALSKDEVQEFMAQFPRGGPRGGGGQRGEDDRPRGGPRGEPNIDMVFGRWDANADGAVSREEFDNRPRRGRQGRQGGPGGRTGPDGD